MAGLAFDTDGGGGEHVERGGAVQEAAATALLHAPNKISIYRTHSLSSASHARQRESPCSAERHDVDQAQARLSTLDGAGAVSASPADITAWPGAALCARSAIVAPAGCLPLAAPVGRARSQVSGILGLSPTGLTPKGWPSENRLREIWLARYVFSLAACDRPTATVDIGVITR